MPKVCIINLLLLLVVQCLSARESQKDIQGQGDADFQKSYKDFENIVRFGVSSKRIWLIQKLVEVKDERYLPLLSEMLRSDGNTQVCIALIKAIEALSLKQHAAYIQGKLRSENIDIQIAAVQSFGNLGVQEAEDALLNLLAENPQSTWLNRSLVIALGKLRSRKSLATLYTLYERMPDDNDTRVTILQAIGGIQDSTSISFLGDILRRSNNPLLRAQAVLSLGKIETAESTQILREYLNDSEEKVVEAVIESLPAAKNYDLFFEFLKNDNDRIRYSALESIAKDPAPHYFPILKYMFVHDTNEKVRYKVIEVLQRIGTQDVLDLWREEMQSARTVIQKHIIQSLEHFQGREQVYAFLKQVFRNAQNEEIRKLIVKRALELSHTEGLTFMDTEVFPLRGDNDLSLKLYGIQELTTQLQRDAITPLASYLENDNHHIRRYAYYFLMLLDDQAAFRVLFQKLRDEKNEELIGYLIDRFQHKHIIDALPILKEHFLKFPSPKIQKLSLQAIERLEKVQSKSRG